MSIKSERKISLPQSAKYRTTVCNIFVILSAQYFRLRKEVCRESNWTVWLIKKKSLQHIPKFYD